MRNIYKFWFKNVACIIITLVLVGAFAFLWYTRLNVMLDKTFLLKGNYVVIGVYAVMTIFFLNFFGGYKIGVSKKSNVIISQVIGIFCTNAVDFVITVLIAGYLSYVPRIFFYCLVMFMVQILLAGVLSYFLMTLYTNIFPPAKMLHISGGNDNNLVAKFNTRGDKYIVTGDITYTVSIDEIGAEIRKYDGVIINDVPDEVRDKILEMCFNYGKKAYFMPKISDIIVRSSESLDVFDTPLFYSRNRAFSFFERMVKRCFDIVLASIGLVLLSPLMMGVSLAIHLYDRGPVFYRQTRYTINRKTFKIFKFRSMIQDAEKDGVARLATENDSRITPVGRFIRACRLDELPQFINILKGDMSFVGPRPERPEIADEYEKEMPEFAYRLKVKAGLTGYAQVYGKYNTTSLDKLKLDMMYVENCSLVLDLKLILLTLKVIFMKESTEGIEEGQTVAK